MQINVDKPYTPNKTIRQVLGKLILIRTELELNNNNETDTTQPESMEVDTAFIG